MVYHSLSENITGTLLQCVLLPSDKVGRLTNIDQHTVHDSSYFHSRARNFHEVRESLIVMNIFRRELVLKASAVLFLK